MIPLLIGMLVNCSALLAQVGIVESPDASQWFATVDNDAPGAQQTVESEAEGGRTWLKWTVATNGDGRFTGYQVQRDIALDLSGIEMLRWRWKTSGRFLQLQFWAGTRLAYWDTSTLTPGRWRTESIAPSQFNLLGGFEPADWGRITRVALRIADSFAGYQEGTTYELGLQFVHGYPPLGEPGPRPAPASDLMVVETEAALTVGSDRYRLELARDRLMLQLYLPDGDKLAPVSPSGLFYGFDREKGRSFDAKPVYEVVERSPGRVLIAAGAELSLPARDAVLVTFVCLRDRFYTAVRYHTPLDYGYECTRFAPSGDAVKGLFDQYAFRDAQGRLHRGSFSEYQPRAGFGTSTFDADGDFMPAYSGDRPYLFLSRPDARRGLVAVYLDYNRRWRGAADNCHFCDYTPDLGYFHLGLGSFCDCADTRATCFYVGTTDDVALIDGAIVPEILAEAASLPLEARIPSGFTVRTEGGEAERAVLRSLRETWGNHMHWIGCGWGPNGDDVLASSVDLTGRMLGFGAAGGVNFDLVGVERMATERPATLEKLKQLLQGDRLEVVGGTYGQPLGGFHGAESNVRQLQWGVRVCERTLGVRPKCFWEEEFYFFPQLPQLLKLMGYDSACLYFQRTWMDPSFPHENATSVVSWQAPDGTRIRTAAHTPISRWMPTNLQSQALAESDFVKRATDPLIVDWNELAGADPQGAEQYRPAYESMVRFGVKPTTLSAYLGAYTGDAPVREYRMDETFHGLPLGKCGDQVRRADKRIENALVAAEALSAGASLEGLAYPSAALTEAWKNLLIFQGHDVEICEGCLRQAYPQYMEAAEKLANQTLTQTVAATAAKVNTSGPNALAAVVVLNPLSWTRNGVVEVSLPQDLRGGQDLVLRDEGGGVWSTQQVGDRRLLFIARDVPPVGYRTFWLAPGTAPTDLEASPDGASVRNQAITVRLDGSGTVRSLKDLASGAELLSPDTPNGELRATIGGKALSSSGADPNLKLVESGPVRAVVEATGSLTGQGRFVNRAIVYSGLPQVAFETDLQVEEQLDGMMTGSLRRVFAPGFTPTFFHDWPFGASATRMTNELIKWFPFPEGNRQDTVRNHVTGLNFLDCQGEKAGLLYAHDGTQGFLRDGAEIANILSLYDPWDAGYFPNRQSFRSALIAHGPWGNSDRLRTAIGFTSPLPAVVEPCHRGPWPGKRSWLRVSPSTAPVCAFYREGEGLFVRLYDVDGRKQEVRVELARPISAADVVDLRGNAIRKLSAEGQGVRLPLGPHEIATLRLTCR